MIRLARRFQQMEVVCLDMKQREVFAVYVSAFNECGIKYVDRAASPMANVTFVEVE
jgi:hypothetical protein